MEEYDVVAADELTRTIRELHFPHHNNKWKRLNHGSFGAVPAFVRSRQLQFQQLWYEQPDVWYYGGIEDELRACRKAVASMVNVDDVDRITIVDNASTGSIMVVQRVMWAYIRGECDCERDCVIMFDSTYGAVKKAVEHFIGGAGARIVTIPLPFPLPLDADRARQMVLSSVEEVLRQERDRCQLIILDHITSAPSVVLPIVELVQMARDHGVRRVFVDGAHSIGQVDVDMKRIAPDYYVSNVHKWCFAPTSAAFFYCGTDEHRGESGWSTLHHPGISHPYGKGLDKECAWFGTRDFSSMLSVLPAIEWYSEISARIAEDAERAIVVDGISSALAVRNHRKAVHWAQHLAAMWGTELGAPPNMVGSMAMIRLPEYVCAKIHSQDDAEALRKRIREEQSIEAVLYYHPPNSLSYVRLSAQLYNTSSDFQALGEAILSQQG